MGGEPSTAEALARLDPSAWRLLHDRRAPDGGNVDHIAVGPPGIVVVDAKNWSDPVTIRPDRRLVHSKHDSTGELHRLAWLVDHGRELLRRDGVTASVRGYLVLTGDADRDRAFEDVGDLRVGGLDRLVGRLERQRRDLAPDLVDAVTATLAAALPAMGAPAAHAAPRDPLAGLAPSPLFEKVHRFYYLSKPWTRGGHRRIYLNDRHGTSLGHTDLNTHAIELTCGPDDHKIAEALLASVEKTGITVAPGEVPKVPTTLFGGRLLSRLASRHASVLVGQEWGAYGKHRMYGVLLDPKVSTADLGWVDLKTGERHPSADAPAAGDRDAPDTYLQYLLHHRPRRGQA